MKTIDETIDDGIVLVVTTDASFGQVSKAINALEEANFEVEESKEYETEDQVGYVISRP